MQEGRKAHFQQLSPDCPAWPEPHAAAFLRSVPWVGGMLTFHRTPLCTPRPGTAPSSLLQASLGPKWGGREGREAGQPRPPPSCWPGRGPGNGAGAGSPSPAPPAPHAPRTAGEGAGPLPASQGRPLPRACSQPTRPCSGAHVTWNSRQRKCPSPPPRGPLPLSPPPPLPLPPAGQLLTESFRAWGAHT